MAAGHDKGDWIDGGAGHDYIAGDNASIQNEPRLTDPRFRTLSGTQILEADGNGAVTSTPQADPDGTPKRSVTVFDLAAATSTEFFGSDAIAGGAENDVVFGQLGDDAIQGDGAVVNLSGAMLHDIATTQRSTDDYAGAGRDGDDYVEGGGGNDTILGNLGQDDLIGGSSELFGAGTANERPDGGDLIFGGSGTRAARNDPGDQSANGHARDADVILGDNGNIFRLVGVNGTASGSGYLRYTYDTYGPLGVVPRTLQYLEYSFGDTNDTQFNDELHGEAGDDVIHGMSGNDVMFGDGQDDDLVAGAGHDRIYGGTGTDGILGDDGRIFTSRNGLTEELHGVTTASTQFSINLPGTLIGGLMNINGRLKKSVDLAAYRSGGHDIAYGGLGDDFIHGGWGDDGLSGAEAQVAWFVTTPAPETSLLQYDASLRMFADYAAGDSLKKIDGFFLNFDATDSSGSKIEDGADSIFGDEGHDWLVGGTGSDRMFSGLGDDLLNADDNLETNGGLNNAVDAPEYADADWAFGGGGLDVLIGNTGADRLFDWSKRFNTYVVPIKPTQASPIVASPTVLRDPTQQIVDLLLAMQTSSGGDNDIDTEANRFYGDIALITVEDGQDFRDQVRIGADRDPVPEGIITGLDTLGGYETLPVADIAVELPTDEIMVSEDGTTATFSVTLTSPPTGDVALTVASLDSGEVTTDLPSLTFTPENWTVPQFVTLTGVDDADSDGDVATSVVLSVDVDNSSAEYVNVSDISVAVTNLDNEPVQPQITSPIGSTESQRPTIEWSAVAGATSYDLWINNFSTGTQQFVRKTVTGTSYTPDFDFGIGVFDVWVRGIVPGGADQPWSVLNRFHLITRVEKHAIVKRQTTYRPTISWNALPGAVAYDIWVDNVSSGESQLYRDRNVIGTQWTPPADLPLSAYRIWVRGVDALGRYARWSSATNLHVVPSPELTNPVHASFDGTPTFDWQPVVGAEKYEVFIQNANNGATVVHQTDVTTTTWTPATALADGQYRWFVIAVGANGFRSDWTLAQSLEIGGRTAFHVTGRRQCCGNIRRVRMACCSGRCKLRTVGRSY